mmetsp:Transcript_98825/g.283892  ORF Transcript_98825/g.283892 Transcript_98825/m.283892 type:complete len:231 (+) Transcript_98825:655-1347(+)
MREVWLEARAGRNDRHLFQHGHQLRQQRGRAVLDPAFDGVGDDENLPHLERHPQKLARQGRCGAQVRDDVQVRVCVEISRAEDGVVPIENGHCVVMRRPLRPRRPSSRVGQFPEVLRPECLMPALQLILLCLEDRRWLFRSLGPTPVCHPDIGISCKRLQLTVVGGLRGLVVQGMVPEFQEATLHTQHRQLGCEVVSGQQSAQGLPHSRVQERAVRADAATSNRRDCQRL